MTDMDKLIAMVETGTFLMDVLPPPHETTAYDAFSGSLDAALRLHEALLPGWEWTIDAGDGATVENRGDFGLAYSADASVGSPARAWLLSILRALKAQEDGQ